MLRVIKKYANRKLYDTRSKRAITLSGIAELIAKGDDIQVIDNPTGNDLTTVTLAQIILEQEKTKRGLLPLPVLLREIIKQGRRSFSETIEKVLLGPSESPFLDEKGAGEVVRDLVEKKRLGKPEGQRLLERIFARMRESQRAIQHQIETRTRETLGRMDIVSRTELQDLRKNLQELRRKVDAMANLKTD